MLGTGSFPLGINVSRLLADMISYFEIVNSGGGFGGGGDASHRHRQQRKRKVNRVQGLNVFEYYFAYDISNNEHFMQMYCRLLDAYFRDIGHSNALLKNILRARAIEYNDNDINGNDGSDGNGNGNVNGGNNNINFFSNGSINIDAYGYNGYNVHNGLYSKTIANEGDILYHLFRFVKQYGNGSYMDIFIGATLEYACLHNIESVISFICQILRDMNGYDKFSSKHASFNSRFSVANSMRSMNSITSITGNLSIFSNNSNSQWNKLQQHKRLVTSAKLIIENHCDTETLATLLNCHNFLIDENNNIGNLYENKNNLGFNFIAKNTKERLKIQNDKKNKEIYKRTIVIAIEERIKRFEKGIETAEDLLEIIDILSEFGVDFSAGIETLSSAIDRKSNVLLAAIDANDVELAEKILQCCAERDILESSMRYSAISRNNRDNSNYVKGRTMLTKLLNSKANPIDVIFTQIIDRKQEAMFELILGCPQVDLRQIKDMMIFCQQDGKVCIVYVYTYTRTQCLISID